MAPPTRPTLPAACLALVGLVATLGGCGSYVLQGQVVQGAFSDMAFVRPGDPRLAQPGVSSVRITVERDPDKLAARVVGSDLSDGSGRFTVALDAFGAGYLAEVFRIRAGKVGYQTALATLALDAQDDRLLLVILAPGPSEGREPEDLLEQFDRFK